MQASKGTAHHSPITMIAMDPFVNHLLSYSKTASDLSLGEPFKKEQLDDNALPFRQAGDNSLTQRRDELLLKR